MALGAADWLPLYSLFWFLVKMIQVTTGQRCPGSLGAHKRENKSHKEDPRAPEEPARAPENEFERLPAKEGVRTQSLENIRNNDYRSNDY